MTKSEVAELTHMPKRTFDLTKEHEVLALGLAFAGRRGVPVLTKHAFDPAALTECPQVGELGTEAVATPEGPRGVIGS